MTAGVRWRGAAAALAVAALAAIAVVIPLGSGTARADDPTPRFDVAKANQALRGSHVYVAPGSQARVDVQRLRRELPSLRAHVVVAPAGTRLSSLDFEDVDGHLIMVSGLQVRSNALLDATLRAVFRRHVRQALETFDVTGLVYAVAAASVKGYAVGERWEPASRPVTPDEVDPLVAALSRRRVHVAAGVLVGDVAKYLEAARDLRYRVLLLPPLAPGAPEPRLLPALAAAFPGEVVVVVRGVWLAAAGPDSAATYAAAQQYAMSLTVPELHIQHSRNGGWYDAAWTLGPFFERLKQLRAGPQWRPPPGKRLDVGATAARAVPWVFAVVALLLGAGALTWWSRNTARARLADARAVRVGRAEILAEMARLAADIHRLEAGDDKVARRRLAEASERYATAGTLYEQADTPEEVTSVKATVAEGLALAAEARGRIDGSAADGTRPRTRRRR